MDGWILVFAAPAAKSVTAFSKLRLIFLGASVTLGAGVPIVGSLHAGASGWTAGNGGGGKATDSFVVLPLLDIGTQVGENDAADARNTKGVAEARNSMFAVSCDWTFFSSVM